MKKEGEKLVVSIIRFLLFWKGKFSKEKALGKEARSNRERTRVFLHIENTSYIHLKAAITLVFAEASIVTLVKTVKKFYVFITIINSFN